MEREDPGDGGSDLFPIPKLSFFDPLGEFTQLFPGLRDVPLPHGLLVGQSLGTLDHEDPLAGKRSLDFADPILPLRRAGLPGTALGLADILQDLRVPSSA